MKKTRVSFAGAGFLAEMYARCLIEMPDVELTAVTSAKEGRARSFSKKYGVKSWYTDYEKMMSQDDSDIVNVCVPNYLHSAVTVSGAEHGKHVICTKPLATSLDQADEMVKACKRSGTLLMYGENWLFAPAVTRIHEIIREGGLGKVVAVEAREQHGGSHSKYATNRKYSGGGVLIHMAVHPIGFIMHLMARPVERVYAELGNLVHKIEVEDYAVMLMRFGGGGSGIAQSNYISRGGMQDRIEVYGTEGMAMMNLTHANPIKVYSDVGYSYVVEKATTSRGWTSPIVDEKVDYGFVAMLKHFVTSSRDGKESVSTGVFGRDVLRAIFAGYESFERKTSVTLKRGRAL